MVIAVLTDEFQEAYDKAAQRAYEAIAKVDRDGIGMFVAATTLQGYAYYVMETEGLETALTLFREIAEWVTAEHKARTN